MAKWEKSLKKTTDMRSDWIAILMWIFFVMPMVILLTIIAPSLFAGKERVFIIQGIIFFVGIAIVIFNIIRIIKSSKDKH